MFEICGRFGGIQSLDDLGYGNKRQTFEKGRHAGLKRASRLCLYVKVCGGTSGETEGKAHESKAFNLKPRIPKI